MTKRYTPKMNRIIMDGLAVHEMKRTEEHLDAQIRSVCEGMPACMKYMGYERCTAQETYEELTKERSNKRQYNLARSSVYLVKYFLVFTDVLGKEHLITRHIFLPYVDDAGIFQSSGMKYHIIPVLSDKVFTPGRDSIFVRLLQDRKNMFRTYHTAVFNGKRETRYVFWATIYNNTQSKAHSVTKAETLLTHYLFAMYGFTETFRRYAGAVPIFGSDDITAEAYPESDWIICETTGVPPSTCLDRVYTPTNIKLAVKKSDWSKEMEILVMGFYYIVDHFTSRFKPKAEYLDDLSLWKILIGLIRFSSDYGENKLLGYITEHFDTLVGYLDTGVKTKLKEKGIELENYYDLLMYIQTHFNEMILQNEHDGLTVYGKNMEVLYYVLYGIIYGFVMCKFNLNKIANKRQLTLKDVTENTRRNIRTGAIYDITSEKIIAELVSYSGDHKYPKITAILTEQESGAGANRGKSDRVMPGPQHWLDLSMVTVGSVLNMPKSNPTPVARVNPWVVIDEHTGTVLPSPKFVDLINANKPKFKL